ncbi:ribulokinase [Candidatus Latescibacterota bacterium]
MSSDTLVIGVDYGTDSVRSLIVDAKNGEEISTAVHYFTRWKEGRYCDPAKNMFRQHPRDHIAGLEISIKESLEKAPEGTAEKIKGISIDTTGSTPVPVSKDGVPLALLPEFEHNPNAMFILWKDHTSVREAEEINHKARTWGGTDFTMYSGGVYSSEWFWSKILHILRIDKDIRKAAFSWMENCDWIPALLTGNCNPLQVKRSRCAAGHKAMWHESFGGLPSRDFLSTLDPLLDGIRDRLYTETFTADEPAGALSVAWANRLGLSVGIPVGVGAFDAHMGAVGGAIRPYALSKVIGTSTCDMLVAPIEEIGDKLVKGICGQVDGSIIPGMLGMEAGQSAYGDIYAWFRDVLLWPVKQAAEEGGVIGAEMVEKLTDSIIPELSKEADKLTPAETGVVALDWMNGRRTPYANQMLKGAVSGLTLGSKAPAIFRALVEATAFGARKINERFESEGVPIKEVIALGGVAKKSPFAMQVLADVLNREIKVSASEQTCALGAAMFAATIGGVYETVNKAIEHMGSSFEATYKPREELSLVYDSLYERYSRLGQFVEDETAKENRGV